MKLRGVLACLVIFGCGSSPKKDSTPLPMGDGTGDTTTEPTPDMAGAPAPTSGKAKSLYDRLGGQPAITAVVDEFVNRTTADVRIKDRFFNTDAANLKKLLVEFVCMASGGPCKYTGRDMESSHGGMEVVEEEWNALVENLIGALDKFKVPEKEKGELLGAVGPLKPQIVAPADKLKPINEKKLAAVSKLQATVKDKAAADLLGLAVLAGKRGQRNYAEQLFTRAEMTAGSKPLASVAATFRTGAPPRILTALKTMPADTAPQPATVGNSDADEPDKKPAGGQLTGLVTVDGKPSGGLGVVMLWPQGGAKKRVAKTRVIEQRNKEFAPRVMAVPVGSTVSFPNFDAIFHNVFSLSKVKPFDLGMYKNGETREVKLDKPGIVRLGCNLHASMAGYLIVVDAPHYAVVNSDGKFAFGSLKPGKYKVQAWNERSGEPTTSELVVKAGANDATLDLKAGTATLGPDKFNVSRQ